MTDRDESEITITDDEGDQVVVDIPDGAVDVDDGTTPPPDPEPDPGPVGDPPTWVGKPTDGFEIQPRLDDGTGAKVLWRGPYANELSSGYGWLAGDRARYQGGAYMFLVKLDAPTVPIWRSFYSVTGYGAEFDTVIFDERMDEAERFWDGTKYEGDDRELKDIPDFETLEVEYRGNHPPTLDLYELDGGLIAEQRPYGALGAIDGVEFDLATSVVTPFRSKGKVSAEHDVFRRDAVVAHWKEAGIAVVVYYDLLVEGFGVQAVAP